MFFKPTQEVESILVAMDREEADMIMDWEDVPDIEQTDSGEQPNKGEKLWICRSSKGGSGRI